MRNKSLQPKVNLGLRIAPELHTLLVLIAERAGKSLNMTAEDLLSAAAKRVKLPQDGRSVAGR